jgi:hypothetical protein
MGVAHYLGINPDRYHPLWVYLPKKDADIYATPDEAFQRLAIYPSGLFSIEREIDNKYIIVPYDFACRLLQQKNLASNIEVKVKKGWKIAEVQQRITKIIGSNYEVLDHFQQQQLLYKIMKSEKWAVFFILVFILMVASLNMLSTMTMIILEKKQNIKIFHFLGADWQRIRRIFLFNGWMSVLLGSIIGLFAGLTLCLLQQHFGGDNPIRIFHQMIQQPPLGGPQTDALAVHDDLAPGKVNLKPIIHPDGFGVRNRKTTGPTQHGFDAIAQLERAERFGDIIIAAGCKGQVLVFLFVFHREHDDGHIGEGPNLT